MVVKMEKALISVVVPTYNRGDLIRRTVDSVLSQTYSNFELIIVDDASTDNTEEIISSYKDSRIRYIKLDENTHGTRPRNTGILQSQGEYIALLDSDDEWLPNKLEKQLDFIKRSGQTDNIVCFTGLIVKDDEKETLSTNRDLGEHEDIMDYMFINNNGTWVQASTYMFSSQLGKKTLFNPELRKHQDIDFCLRLRNSGAKFINFQEHLTIYHHEKREGRVGNNNKFYLSIEWGENVKKDLSIRAYHSFLLMFVVYHLMVNGRKKEASKIYYKAYKSKTIDVSTFIKGIIKCSIPTKLLLYIWNKKGTEFT